MSGTFHAWVWAPQREKSSLNVRPSTFHKYLGLSVTWRPWAKFQRHCSHRTHVLLLLKKSWPHQLFLPGIFIPPSVNSPLAYEPREGRERGSFLFPVPPVQSILSSCAQSILLSRPSAWRAFCHRLFLFIWQWFVFLLPFSTPTTNQVRAGCVSWSDNAHRAQHNLCF